MPRKVRQLKKDLRDAGFTMRHGKGSHTVWSHPDYAKGVSVSGNDGDDADHYQERDVRRAIEAVRNVP